MKLIDNNGKEMSWELFKKSWPTEYITREIDLEITQELIKNTTEPQLLKRLQIYETKLKTDIKLC